MTRCTITTGNSIFAVRPENTAKGFRNTAKALPWTLARQSPHGIIRVGKELCRALCQNNHGKDFAVCLPYSTAQWMCQKMSEDGQTATTSLPWVSPQTHGIVHRVCRAYQPRRTAKFKTLPWVSPWPHGEVWIFAVIRGRRPTAKTMSLPWSFPEDPRHITVVEDACLGSLPCACTKPTRHIDHMVHSKHARSTGGRHVWALPCAGPRHRPLSCSLSRQSDHNVTDFCCFCKNPCILHINHTIIHIW